MKLRRPNGERWFSPEEDAALMRLVFEAFDLRDGPYCRDAVEAVADWSERTRPDRLERHARREAS